MDLTESLKEAVVALKVPLEPVDREQGWTDELRREIQEEISVHRSMLRRHGIWNVRYVRLRLDAWMDAEGVQPGRLRDVVLGVQALVVEARDAARLR
ncbi:hypothetical protein ACFWVP_12825 [Streptomyces sp. NPDC058637]|uniref:hypothetical protein n=1 Tax=Streptomyces sp. NPDC058637 TaxID=3346569 RepID=UPI0036473829